MNVGHHLLLPDTVDSAKRREFYEIFAKAAKTDSVRAAYAVDYCEPANIPEAGLDKFFTTSTTYWKSLASKVKIN
jgi:tripartite-type tricarboxylate transporter receptor subunit TctC